VVAVSFLDHDRRDVLSRSAYFGNPAFAGPMPVDGDNGEALRQAVAGHQANFRMVDFIREFPCRDDGLPYDPGFTGASFSPCQYAATTRPEVAVLSVSGWMDGAGFTNGAISRFLSLPNPQKHLLIGPWDHGARTDISPWRTEAVPSFPWLAEVLRFFDEYLMGRHTGLRQESPVHWFTLGAEQWHEGPNWPPPATTLRLPIEAGAYAADVTLGTGANSRYARLAAFNVSEYYPDWHGRDAHMHCSTSAPLEHDVVVTGHPVLTLDLASSEPDAALHAYLEDVAPDGTTRYVTEGLLRALHRAERPAPRLQQTVGPSRSFARADARPLVPGVAETLRFALLPTSWRFPAGHRIRIAIACADVDNFGQTTHGRPPVLTFGAPGSWLELPVVE
jgi:predicted acyl esterase